MKNLKRLGAAVVLTLALGLSALAGEAQTPPCADPGQVQTPPCAASQMATPGDVGSPSSASTDPSAISTPPEAPFTEIATGVLYSLLSLF
jgi:hypothetical protein